MSDKQREAVRLIRAIADCVQTHPQLTEDEPGGYCTEADQLMDEAAALLRIWSVDIERKDALLRQALAVLNTAYGDGLEADKEIESVYESITSELAK